MASSRAGTVPALPLRMNTTDALSARTSTEAIAKHLASLYAKVGLPCTIDAGPVGLVVYSSSQAKANAIATKLLEAAVTLDPAAKVERAIFERDEEPATCWVAVVAFDWHHFPSSTPIHPLTGHGAIKANLVGGMDLRPADLTGKPRSTKHTRKTTK